MALSSDWREFLELLNARSVDYVIVGAHCLAFHGRPRYTGDLDVLVRPSKSNAVALVALLKEFGFAGSKFTPVDFAEGDQVVQLGRPPSRIDLLTSLTGVTSEEAFAGKIEADIDGVPVFMLGKKELIQNKRAVGRPHDLADLAELEQ
jgi:predicted nucleotidyltransferase